MKKLYTLGFALCISIAVFAQGKINMVDKVIAPYQVDLLENSKIGVKPQPSSIGIMKSGGAQVIPLGSSANVYSTILGGQNQVAYDPMSGAIVFIHRQNGDPSGTMLFDASLDGGENWEVNQGPLSPGFDDGTITGLAGGLRYPSVTIANPDESTDPNDVYVVGHGPALSDETTAWGNLFEVSAKIDGSEASEAYTDPTDSLFSFHPYGLVTANGEFWSLSTSYNTTEDVTRDTLVYQTFYLNRGNWDVGDNNVDWTVAEIFNENWYQVDITANGSPDNFVSSWGLNFSPDGQTGYALMMGAEISETGLDTIPHPVVYKSIDAGDSWTELPEFDFSTIQVFQDILAIPEGEEDVRPYFSDFDMVVDNDGKLHLFVEMLSGFGGAEEDLTFIFADLLTQHLCHVSTTDGTDWDAALISGIINTDDGVVGAIGLNKRPQATRSPNGEFLVFTWSEDDDNEAISFPDVIAVAYDVVNDVYSDPENLTVGTDAEEFAFWPTLAPIMKDNGSCFDYELNLVFSEPSGSDLQPIQYYYLYGVGFNAGDLSWTSVEEQQLQASVNVYPNPSSGIVFIESPQNFEFNVEIYDNLGRLVHSEYKAEGRLRMQIPNLTSGLYIISLEKDGTRSSKKLIIE